MTPTLLLALVVSLSARADEGEATARTEHDSVEAWLARLDGEVPEPELLEAVEEASEEDLGEQAFLHQLHGLDVPDDYYRDPRRVLLGDPLFLARLDLTQFDIPVVVNEHVERWMRYLLGSGRRYTHRWLQRKSRYETMILAEVEASGLPRDLVYLSMIESGFNPHAYSHAHAAGLWQFIPGTARAYQLDVDYWLDERRDPELATRAALRLLKDLHRQFGDWALAFAAYNAGPARVRRALAHAGEGATYWDLYEQDLLPQETKGYVPKILAAAIIGHDPVKYGLVDIVPEEALVYDRAVVDFAVDVEVLARCADLDEEAFRALNPALRRHAIPEGGVDIRVPQGEGEAFLAKLAAVPPDERQRLVLHAVARGESLSGIAGRYGVSVDDVMRANRLTNPNRLSIGQKLIIPVRGDLPVTAAEATSAKAPGSRPAVYTVRSGDTLSEIGERFGMSVGDLQRLNGLADVGSLRAGQTLRLVAAAAPAPASTAEQRYTVRAGDSLSVIAERHGVKTTDLVAWNGLSDASSIRVGQVLVLRGSASPASAAPQSETVAYTVQRGDTLSGIAARFGVSVVDVQRANGLRDVSSLQAGQRLRIETAGEVWSTHVVKPGESLGIIAQKNGVSVADLRSWNGLSGSTIYAGDRLRVRKR